MLPASCRQLRAGSPRSPENRAHDRTFRVAHASGVLAMTSRQRGLFCKRSFRRDAETSTRDARALAGIRFRAHKPPTPQCAGTMGPVSQQHAHPATSPTLHQPVRIAFLFPSTQIPFSNSTGRKSHAPILVVLVKSKWQ